MSWRLREILRKRCAAESGAIVKDPGGRALMALVSPAGYAVGMGNLAVHALYDLFNRHPAIACERVFFPEAGELREHLRTGTELLSLESQRSLGRFDVIAFTISFENDLLRILPILELARIPHRREERGGDWPFLVAGGVAPTLNPRPLAAIFDAVILGEAEGFARDLVPLIARRAPRAEFLSELEAMEGVWIPASDKPSQEVRPRRIADLDPWPVQTVIHSNAAKFGDLHLIEVQRGCPFRCRFCATPAIYGAARQRSAKAILRMVEEGLARRRRFGLVGTHLMSHPEFAPITRAILDRGAAFSLSSIRAAEVDEEKAALLARAGQSSVALGVEAGSERLRDEAGKGLSDGVILDAVGLLARQGIMRLRLYFMIGLPGEGDDDVAAIAELSKRIRDELRRFAPKRSRTTSVDLTLSPFVPKPGTPWAKAPFAGEKALKGKIAAIQGALRREEGIAVGSDPVHEAALEAKLSSADEGAIEFLEERHARRRRVQGRGY